MHRQIHLGEIDITGEIAKATGRIRQGGPRHFKHVARRRAGTKFDWSLQDHAQSPHRQLAHGRAFTRRGAWRAVHQALLAELDRLAAERAGLRDRDADAELGCE